MPSAVNSVIRIPTNLGKSLRTSLSTTMRSGMTQKDSPKQNQFTFHERTGPKPQAFGTTFEARVQDYMAPHTKRMERSENAIFKKRGEINDKMTE
ncbi:hypothetical protein Tco_0473689, partial [Tanacetum coccineum]